MWRWREELKEIAWLIAVVCGLSVLAVSLAVAASMANPAHISKPTPRPRLGRAASLRPACALPVLRASFTLSPRTAPTG